MPKLSQNKDLPVAIIQLRLCSALKNCGPLGVENAFDKSSDENLYVYDDVGLHYTDWTNAEPTVHIPADTRSAFPVISVQSPVSIQCCWQS